MAKLVFPSRSNSDHIGLLCEMMNSLPPIKLKKVHSDSQDSNLFRFKSVKKKIDLFI
jgi:hypothetical protein